MYIKTASTNSRRFCTYVRNLECLCKLDQTPTSLSTETRILDAFALRMRKPRHFSTSDSISDETHQHLSISDGNSRHFPIISQNPITSAGRGQGKQRKGKRYTNNLFLSPASALTWHKFPATRLHSRSVSPSPCHLVAARLLLHRSAPAVSSDKLPSRGKFAFVFVSMNIKRVLEFPDFIPFLSVLTEWKDGRGGGIRLIYATGRRRFPYKSLKHNKML